MIIDDTTLQDAYSANSSLGFPRLYYMLIHDTTLNTMRNRPVLPALGLTRFKYMLMHYYIRDHR